MTLSMGDFFVTAEPSGAVFCNRKQANQWELWRMEERPGGNFAFKSFHNKYLSVQPGGAVVADRTVADSWETFARSGPVLLPAKPGPRPSHVDWRGR
ncbi:MAG: hypothetical protein J0L92_03415 [Deltaproteobacteria bacterium]|nr:hypothetical protein [Deltaproteobacteria bacterium]